MGHKQASSELLMRRVASIGPLLVVVVALAAWWRNWIDWRTATLLVSVAVAIGSLYTAASGRKKLEAQESGSEAGQGTGSVPDDRQDR